MRRGRETIFWMLLFCGGGGLFLGWEIRVGEIKKRAESGEDSSSKRKKERKKEETKNKIWTPQHPSRARREYAREENAREKSARKKRIRCRRVFCGTRGKRMVRARALLFLSFFLCIFRYLSVRRSPKNKNLSLSFSSLLPFSRKIMNTMQRSTLLTQRTRALRT